MYEQDHIIYEARLRIVGQIGALDPEMKPEPSREEALFQAAAQLIGAERAVFLNGACHGDSSLRQRLEARLSAHEQPDSMPVTRGEVTLSTMKMEFPDGTADQAVGQTLGRLPRQRGWALAGVVRNRWLVVPRAGQISQRTGKS